MIRWLEDQSAEPSSLILPYVVPMFAYVALGGWKLSSVSRAASDDADMRFARVVPTAGIAVQPIGQLFPHESGVPAGGRLA